MTRQEKYPNTSTFCYYNANPRNRITEDCMFRAISLATGYSWEEIVKMYYELVIETKYDGEQVIDKLLSNLGWVKHKQPRKPNNTKYTGKEFCHSLACIEERYIANIGSHHMVAIINGRVNDIWDSTDGCIGNYWTREE